jgi:hypothetical protein
MAAQAQDNRVHIRGVGGRVTNLFRFSFTGIVLLGAIAARPNAPVLANEVVAQATISQNSAIRSVPYPGHIFAIRVETNKQTYRFGEPIEIRISITNRTDQPCSIHYIPAWALSGLKVTDSRGNQIAVTKLQPFGRADPRARYNFAPRQTVTLGWTDIGQFGYSLTEPGSCIISASLHGGGSRNTPSGGLDNFGLSGEEKASPVAIRILP